MILLLKKNSILLKEWSDSTAFTHSFTGYMWIMLVTIRCGRWWQWWWGPALFDSPQGGTSQVGALS